MSTAFADPAKYELYDCKQLETARTSLAVRTAELQGLMAKAETGVGGTVVAELAYRNEYIAVRGQSKFADEAWQRNRCVAGAPARRGRAGAAGHRAGADATRRPRREALGPVDSKDSLLGANQIQSCFWGGSLGCEGPFGFERRGMGADGAPDHRPARPEGLHWTG